MARKERNQKPLLSARIAERDAIIQLIKDARPDGKNRVNKFADYLVRMISERWTA